MGRRRRGRSRCPPASSNPRRRTSSSGGASRCGAAGRRPGSGGAAASRRGGEAAGESAERRAHRARLGAGVLAADEPAGPLLDTKEEDVAAAEGRAREAARAGRPAANRAPRRGGEGARPRPLGRLQRRHQGLGQVGPAGRGGPRPGGPGPDGGSAPPRRAASVGGGRFALDVQPTIITYNTVMDAWSKHGGGGCASEGEEEEDDDARMRCGALLRRMEGASSSGRNPLAAPDAHTYNIVPNAHARRGDPDGAEAVLGRMLSSQMRSASSGRPSPDDNGGGGGDDDSGGNSEVGGGGGGGGGEAPRMRSPRPPPPPPPSPDVFSYASVMNAWAKSGRPDAASRAEDLLRRMIESHERTGDGRLAPDRVVFGTLIALYANRPSRVYEDGQTGAENADRVLSWLLRLHRNGGNDPSLSPFTGTFALVMNAHA